jgi:hypothetical protein
MISLVHDFRIGPASTAASQSDDRKRAERLRKTASWLGRINALLALAIVFLAIALVGHGPRGCAILHTPDRAH